MIRHIDTFGRIADWTILFCAVIAFFAVIRWLNYHGVVAVLARVEAARLTVKERPLDWELPGAVLECDDLKRKVMIEPKQRVLMDPGVSVVIRKLQASKEGNADYAWMLAFSRTPVPGVRGSPPTLAVINTSGQRLRELELPVIVCAGPDTSWRLPLEKGAMTLGSPGEDKFGPMLIDGRARLYESPAGYGPGGVEFESASIDLELGDAVSVPGCEQEDRSCSTGGFLSFGRESLPAGRPLMTARVVRAVEGTNILRPGRLEWQLKPSLLKRLDGDPVLSKMIVIAGLLGGLGWALLGRLSTLRKEAA